ncbi:MAG: hypothetical protein K6D97_03240 [Clostridia bacterium]|nr:hypothetical protein [Clostridia bacterium]
MIILEKLNDVLDKLNRTEKEQMYLELALFNKNKEELKEEKLENEKYYLENQARFYNQNPKKVKENILLNSKLYEILINKIIFMYDSIFEDIVSYKQNILNNQKILVGNVIFYTQKIEGEENEEIKNQYYSEINGMINKSKEFERVLNECDEKIIWLKEDMIKSINSLFINRNVQIAINDSIINRTIRGIKHFFVGKRMYKSINNSYVSMINDLSKAISDKEKELAKFSITLKKHIKNSKKRILKAV